MYLIAPVVKLNDSNQQVAYNYLLMLCNCAIHIEKGLLQGTMLFPYLLAFSSVYQGRNVASIEHLEKLQLNANFEHIKINI